MSKRRFYQNVKTIACIAGIFGAAFLAQPQMAAAQGTPDPRIVRIRQQYEAIDAPSRQYTVRKYEKDYENSTDVYTGFYDKGELCKIVVVSSGERDQTTTKFYLQKGQVFFIHRIITQFSSLSDNKGTSSEQRFYFSSNHLIRWLDAIHKEKLVDNTEAIAVTREFASVQRTAATALAKSKK